MRNNYSFKVSVIIPVYNADPFLRRAVESSLEQEEVAEIILVEDGSQDDSLSLCQLFEREHEKIFLYRHPRGENRGAGYSRNLGIEKAKHEYIAFLDVDDYFLAGRFKYTKELFNNKSIDGVHEVIGVEYESEEIKKYHLNRMILKKKNIVKPLIPLDHTGIESKVNPESLFYSLLKTEFGWIHLNGLVLRKDSLKGLKLFNDNFLGQDSEFITRLAAERRLVGTGFYDPVAIRYVHKGNRILQVDPVKKNKSSIDNEYWLKYTLQKKTWSSEVFYLLLRVSDSKSKLKKAKVLVVNLLKVGMIFLKNKELQSTEFMKGD